MENKILRFMNSTKKRIIFVLCVFALIFISLFAVRTYSIHHIKETLPQSFKDKIILENSIKNKFPEESDIIHPLPYKTKNAELEIKAKSAILVNVETGDILFEKNADEIIPPASMTKVFLMYTVFQKLNEGLVTLDDEVELLPEVWASHMPPHSSLMFLGKNQKVTLRELLTGLCVCSGNDASHAIALYLFGSEEQFLKKVNQNIQVAGLRNTVITEPSGYSEQNKTTAREMAAFAVNYIRKYPESLSEFHSVKKFVYPKEKNIAPEDRNKKGQSFANGIPDSIWSPVEQENTNKLLGELEGCDGLKTGFINESGYNIALTCLRNGKRYLSVTMGGPGSNIFEGDRFRREDGKTLQEFAFGNFKTVKVFGRPDFTVPVLGASEDSCKLVVPIPLDFDFPESLLGSEKSMSELFSYETEIPECILGEVECGKEYGKIKIKFDEKDLFELPLLADRSLGKAKTGHYFLDRIVYLTF